MSIDQKAHESFAVAIAQLKALMFDAPPEERAKFDKARDDVEALVGQHGDYGRAIVVLRGLEFLKDNASK